MTALPFKLFLFVSTASSHCSQCIQGIRQSGLPFSTVRLDSKETRDLAANGSSFSIDTVPTLVIEYEAEAGTSIQVLKGCSKILQWATVMVSRLRERAEDERRQFEETEMARREAEEPRREEWDRRARIRTEPADKPRIEQQSIRIGEEVPEEESGGDDKIIEEVKIPKTKKKGKKNVKFADDTDIVPAEKPLESYFDRTKQTSVKPEDLQMKAKMLETRRASQILQEKERLRDE